LKNPEEGNTVNRNIGDLILVDALYSDTRFRDGGYWRRREEDVE